MVRIAIRSINLVVVMLASCQAVSAEEFRAIFWNLHSGNSNASFLASQMAEKPDIDFWGLSEVKNQSAVDTFVEALQDANPSTEYVAKISEEGGGDRLAIIYRADRLKAIPYPGRATVDDIGDNFFEVDSVDVSGTLRPSLGVALESSAHTRVVVLVNHWKCCGEVETQEKQAIQTNSFVIDTPDIPVVVAGDHNMSLPGAKKKSPFRELKKTLTYIEPKQKVGTFRSGSVLDSVFTTARTTGWETKVSILNRSGFKKATTKKFKDNSKTTDHRPLLLEITSDEVERIEALREAIAETRAGLERMEAELERLEADE